MFEQWMKFWRDWVFWWLPGGDRGEDPSQPAQKSQQQERASAESTAQRKTAQPAGQPTTSAGAAADDLTAIKGIGPSTAKKLAGMGVASFPDLAAADPNDLARRLDSRPVTPERVRAWIAEAKKRAG
jgi:predicted flap endonuclease-1-like 5' DNA nuclease